MPRYLATVFDVVIGAGKHERDQFYCGISAGHSRGVVDWLPGLNPNSILSPNAALEGPLFHKGPTSVRPTSRGLAFTRPASTTRENVMSTASEHGPFLTPLFRA